VTKRAWGAANAVPQFGKWHSSAMEKAAENVGGLELETET
jgi:hypothetical protein